MAGSRQKTASGHVRWDRERKEAFWSFMRPTSSYNRQDWVPYGAPAAATPLSLTSAWGPGLAGLAPPSLSSLGVRTEGTAATGASEELSSLLPHVRPRRGMSPFLAGILGSSCGWVGQQPPVRMVCPGPGLSGPPELGWRRGGAGWQRQGLRAGDASSLLASSVGPTSVQSLPGMSLQVP